MQYWFNMDDEVKITHKEKFYVHNRLVEISQELQELSNSISDCDSDIVMKYAKLNKEIIGVYDNLNERLKVLEAKVNKPWWKIWK